MFITLEILGWGFICVGAILIGIGGLLANVGWKEMNANRSVNGAALLTFSILFIGAGGVETQSGWRSIDLRSNKIEMVVAVAREWSHNNHLFHSHFLYTSNDLNELGSGAQFPLIDFSRIETATTSMLFNPKDSLEGNWIDLLNIVRYRAIEINRRFEHAESRFSDEIDRIEVARGRIAIRESPVFMSYINVHNDLRNFLEKEFPEVRRHLFAK